MEEISDDIVEKRLGYSIPTVRRFTKVCRRFISAASLFICNIDWSNNDVCYNQLVDCSIHGEILPESPWRFSAICY